MMRVRPLCVAAACGAAWLASVAGAQPLTENNVLVVYDSRISSSLLVAEHYAGSANVPGGVGGVAGARPGVHVVDMASLGVGPFGNATITATDYKAGYRDPLRAYLTSQGLQSTVRSIVLTKGLPHRIFDHDSGLVGDQPANAAAEFNAGDASYSSMDSEMTMLWQNLDNAESGGSGDSRSDGTVQNPYHTATAPIMSFPSVNITSFKPLTNQAGSLGQYYIPSSAFEPPSPFAFTPGDIYLVCRLDGHTVDDVRAMIDRAQNIVVDPAGKVFILDEGGSEGTPDVDGNDGEIDNDPFFGVVGDDYELTRDVLLADSRFSAGVRYDPDAGASNFLVGPLIDFGGGDVITEDVLLLASEGQNHSGGEPGNAGRDYAASFNYAPGAVFNSIESFNGRALNGIGTISNQEQAADFIGAGGTFAIGQVFEPFSFSVADNLYIVQNLHINGLTWAEAAYSSLPVLSWQQIVLGDPLATITFATAEPCPCDWDGSEVVDSGDFFAFITDFLAGDADYDGSMVTDSGDFFGFIGCFIDPVGSGC